MEKCGKTILIIFILFLTIVFISNTVESVEIDKSKEVSGSSPIVLPNSEYLNVEDFTIFEQSKSGSNEENINFNSLLNIWTIILSLTLIIPIAIYLKYMNLGFISRKKYNYDDNHMPNTLKNNSPALINALLGKGFKNVGEVNINGFQATILDLINRKYLKANFVKSNKKKEPQSQENEENYKILLKINREHVFSNKANIKKYEKNILRCLHSIEKKGIIDFENSAEMFKKRTKDRIFKENYMAWSKNLEEEYFSNGRLNKYYNDNSNDILKNYGIVVTILSFFTFAFLIFQMSFQSIVMTSLVFIVGLVLIITPSKNLGTWTSEGKTIKNKWDKFEKCVKNRKMGEKYNIIASYKWDEYLSYGATLGLSKELNENFKDFPPEILNNMELYPYFKYSIFTMINEYVSIGLGADSSYTPQYNKNRIYGSDDWYGGGVILGNYGDYGDFGDFGGGDGGDGD